jgi:hypothetical protein
MMHKSVKGKRFQFLLAQNAVLPARIEQTDAEERPFVAISFYACNLYFGGKDENIESISQIFYKRNARRPVFCNFLSLHCALLMKLSSAARQTFFDGIRNAEILCPGLCRAGSFFMITYC